MPLPLLCHMKAFEQGIMHVSAKGDYVNVVKDDGLYAFMLKTDLSTQDVRDEIGKLESYALSRGFNRVWYSLHHHQAGLEEAVCACMMHNHTQSYLDKDRVLCILTPQ